MERRLLTALFCLFLATFFYSCEKSNYEVVSNFNVRLNATAYSAEQVNIQISKVSVNYSDSGWVDLVTPEQVYNILDYQTSDTLLASGKLPATSIVNKVKIVFGTNNTLKTGGKTLPLQPGGRTELILDAGRKLNKHIENLTVRLNTALSITTDSNGSYIFNPVAEVEQ